MCSVDEFTGLDGIEIAIANSYGLDKQNWLERLLFVELNWDNLGDFIDTAKEKFLFRKAINALEQMKKGVAVTYNMFLDATSSGTQILAALSGDIELARMCNLVDTGERENIYQYVSDQINIYGFDTRDKDVKLPFMRYWYNKQNEPELKEAEETFYEVTNNGFEGANIIKDLVNNAYDSSSEYQSWTLPNGNVAVRKSLEMVDKSIEVDELDHTKFTYRYKANKASDNYIGLMACVIQSIDAYIVEEMIERCNFYIASIHD